MTRNQQWAGLMILGIALSFTLHYPLNIIQAAVCACRLGWGLRK